MHINDQHSTALNCFIQFKALFIIHYRTYNNSGNSDRQINNKQLVQPYYTLHFVRDAHLIDTWVSQHLKLTHSGFL